MLLGKNPSSDLRLKHENIAITNTTHATKILWVVLFSPNCNMYPVAPLWKPFLRTVVTDESLFGLTLV